eukprot:950900-Pleurochrysis_carterae.AAC.10
MRPHGQSRKGAVKLEECWRARESVVIRETVMRKGSECVGRKAPTTGTDEERWSETDFMQNRLRAARLLELSEKARWET